MDAERRRQHGDVLTERIRVLSAEIANTIEAARAAEFEAYRNDDIVNGSSSDIRRVQARNYTAPLDAKLRMLEGELEAVRGQLDILKTTPAQAA